MRSTKPKVPPESLDGLLLFGQTIANVVYAITGDDKLRSGKGSLVADPEELRAAFRAGRVTLRLRDGHDLPIIVTAHTSGGDTAYFEIGN